VFSWPPFVVTGQSVIYKQAATTYDFCHLHINVDKNKVQSRLAGTQLPKEY
jgi:hypothetical protein